MRIFIATATLIPALTGCSSSVLDAFRKSLDQFLLNQEITVVLVTNSTTQNQPECTQSNSITIQKSAPKGKTLYCRERSRKVEALAVGEVCSGGVTVHEIEVSQQSKDCSEITLCGVVASSVKTVGERSDGGTIDEFQFSNLPWGCEVALELSFDPLFANAPAKTLELYVQPPDCPFCARQNRRTCLACTDLTENEEIISGQVVVKQCSGDTCLPCEILHKSGEFVPHGEGQVYFKTDSASCELKCNMQSALRICNNGLWMGDPGYEYPVCYDTVCGCELPNDPIRYAHGAIKTIYKSTEPLCGLECQTESLVVKCKDGAWMTGQPQRPVTESEFAQYPARTCAKRICHCPRADRYTVADGATQSVWSKGIVTCTENCNAFKGSVTCNSGILSATNPLHLNYAYDGCSQEDCGCRIPLAGGNSILLANGGTTTLYQYDANGEAVPNACSDRAFRVQVTCTNKVLSPYDSTVFRYQACIETPLSCKFTDGAGNQVEVDHLATLTVSVTSNPGCGVSCQNLTIKCSNHVFKKRVVANWVEVTAVELAQYRDARACTPRNCDCYVNDYVIPYGTTAPNFFKTAKVTDCNLNGCQEANAALTCTENGVVSNRGDNPNEYLFKSCEVILCECAVPWGGTIENGKTVKVFHIDKGACDPPAAQKACEDPTNFKLITCNNGQLTPYDQSTFPYPTCAPPICLCTYNNVQTPFGQKLRVYQLEEPPTGTVCAAISADITCNEGGTWTGASPDAFPYTQCVDFTDDGSGGGSGGGTGNDEGPGAGIKKRIGLDDGYSGGGGPCLSFDSCARNRVVVRTPMFRKQACILPWGGGEIEFYGSVVAFDTMCVAQPGKCSSHRIIRTCHFLKWTGSDTYRYPSCEEKETCP